MVNQTRLSARAAVPTALLALEVQRGGIPGAPRGTVKSVKRHRPSCWPALVRAFRFTLQLMNAGFLQSNHSLIHRGHAREAQDSTIS